MYRQTGTTLTSHLISYTIDATTAVPMVLKTPEYILAGDSFNVSCQTNIPSSLKVKKCVVTSKHFQRDPVSKTFYWEYQVMHDENPCEVVCYSSKQNEVRKIPVRGKD